MLSDKEKRRIEKCVVQIECIKKDGKEKPILGTGFFIDKNVVVTARHVVDDYICNQAEFDVFITPLKVGINKKIKVTNNIETEDNQLISLLLLEEAVDSIDIIKFTSGYSIQRGNSVYSYGYPEVKRDIGYVLENQISTSINDVQSNRIDWDLNVGNSDLRNYKGFSGAPVFIKNKLVGLFQSESEENGRAISLGISSVDLIHQYIPEKYVWKCENILEVQGIPDDEQHKLYSIEDIDKELREKTEPSIGIDFFEIDDLKFKGEFKQRIKEQKIHVQGRSREETFYCVLNELYSTQEWNRVVIVGDLESWDYLKGQDIQNAILVPNFYVGQIVAIKNNTCIFIYGEDEHCVSNDKIKLRRRTQKTILEKLKEAGMESSFAYELLHDTKGLFVPLLRKLFNGRFSRPILWQDEKGIVFIVALLCGMWTDNKGDKEIIEELTGISYDDFLRNLSPFMKVEEPFIIEVLGGSEKKYQIANLELAWEILSELIQHSLWQEFLCKAKTVINDVDPIFYKPEEEHFKASIFEEKAKYSYSLKHGMIRTIILRAVREGTEYQSEIDEFVKNILGEIRSYETWGYYSQFLSDFAEASPRAELNRIEEEMKNPGLFIKFLSSGSRDIFGRNYYTNIFFAIEQLLYFEETQTSTIKLLFEIDDFNINYSISNSSKSVLLDIFCTWFNKYPIDKTVKERLIEFAMSKYENTWDLVFEELPSDYNSVFSSGIGPKYRKQKESVEIRNQDMYELNYKYAQLCIDYLNNDVDKWVKIIDVFSIFPDKMMNGIIKKFESEICNLEEAGKRILKDKLREEIYNHRHHSNTDWAMEEINIQKLEKLFEKLVFKNKINDFLYIFDIQKTMPLINPIPFDEKNNYEENEKKREEKVSQIFDEIKMSNINILDIVKAVEKENYRLLGAYVAKYYSKGHFDEVFYKDLSAEKRFNHLLLSYIEVLYNINNKDDKIILHAIELSKNNEEGRNLYINLLKIQQLKLENCPLILFENEEIKRQFWSKAVDRYKINHDRNSYHWALQNLKKYDNINEYLGCLYIGLKILPPEDIFYFMKKLTDFQCFENFGQMSKYYLLEILKFVFKINKNNFEKYEDMANVEMKFAGVLSWKEMKASKYYYKRDPSHYAKLVDIIYLHEGEEQGEKTKEKKERIEMLFHFYYHVLFCPAEDNGDVDLHDLKNWVENFKIILDKQKQSHLFTHELGRLFAHSPVGNDGLYPHESVREIIEEISDDSFVSAYLASEIGKRGVYSPDAGRTEMEMAIRYKENAEALRIKYSKTAEIFDFLYKRYFNDSAVERERAENEY